MLYEEQYTQALETLDNLLEIVGEDESHPFYELLDTLGIMIAAYEEIHHSVDDVVSGDVLRFLMDEHQLTPSHLPELGDPKTVSELLAGKRELNVSQIRALSKRFKLSPATFF
ncbi:MAG: transcriptional regulator [Anaerolineae bacterium]|nr:transcriptional regulator [Anaerolineales bacterium]MCQ3975942.1 transcriptional regulator [Anaerolineae bacterium]